MRIRDVAPYLVFALSYLLFEFSLSSAMDMVMPQSLSPSYELPVIFLVAAALAVFLARRVGRLTYAGLLMTSAFATTLKYLLVFLMLCMLAAQTGSPASVGERFLNFVRLLDWRVGLQAFLTVALPVAWLFAFKHFPKSSGSPA